jgi:hypothetical protein
MTALIIDCTINFWLIAIAASAVFNLWADYTFDSLGETISELRHMLYKCWRSFLDLTDDYE